MSLDSIKGWLLDLNGVFYVGDRAVEGAARGLRWLRRSGAPCRFVSNTTTPGRAKGANSPISCRLPPPWLNIHPYPLACICLCLRACVE